MAIRSLSLVSLLVALAIGGYLLTAQMRSATGRGMRSRPRFAAPSRQRR
jgi:hypothetical protein